jgi:uncharacterized protein Yka (UPF0111/DUF47 family)
MANLFPVEHDFYAMLDRQAELTRVGVVSFTQWLERNEDRLGLTVLEKEHEADDARHQMEDILVESFSTPFDRGDIYEVSHQMDQILTYAKSTLREAAALDVMPPQPHYEEFAEALRAGVTAIAEAVHLLGSDPGKSEERIRDVRAASRRIRETYYECLSDVAKETDVNLALRRREIYHHLKDAGVMMDRTTDILHRIIVRVL